MEIQTLLHYSLAFSYSNLSEVQTL